MLGQVLRLLQRCISIDSVPLSVDQEFREVPFDAFAAEQAARVLLEPLIQRMCGVSVQVTGRGQWVETSLFEGALGGAAGVWQRAWRHRPRHR
jgi:hypothetical protein